MRRAKEVKVINRWKAEDFDGEIPIGGDEEMLGTAMKMANGVGQLQGVVQDSMPIIQPVTWFGFYGGGGYVAGNGAASLFSKTDDDSEKALTYYAGRAVYFGVSGLFNIMANGIPQSLGEVSRAGGVFAGTAMLGYRQSSSESVKIDSLLLKGALASYGVAGASYLVEKVKERFF